MILKETGTISQMGDSGNFESTLQNDLYGIPRSTSRVKSSIKTASPYANGSHRNKMRAIIIHRRI